MTSKSAKRSDILFFIGGIALIVIGSYFLNENMDYFNDSLQAEGIVIDIEKYGGNKSPYHPVISFQAANGNTYTFSPETGANFGDYEKGEIVKVKYNEENPDMAKIDSFKERYALPLALISAGLLVSLALGIKIYNFFNKIKLSRELPITGTRLQLPGRVELHTPKNASYWVIISDWQNTSDSKNIHLPARKYFLTLQRILLTN